jgi:hypothetical protein
MENKNPAFLTVIRNLEENLTRIQYGEASVSLKIHAGRVVSVKHSLTENTRMAISEEKHG